VSNRLKNVKQRAGFGDDFTRNCHVHVNNFVEKPTYDRDCYVQDNDFVDKPVHVIYDDENNDLSPICI